MNKKTEKDLLKDALRKEVSPLLIGLRNDIQDLNKSIAELTVEAKKKSEIEIEVDPSEASNYWKGEKGDTVVGPQGPEGQKGKMGPTGPRGIKGYTPIFEVDFWTKEQQTVFAHDILVMATPIKGVHYFDGKDGAIGDRGEKGADGTEISAEQVRDKLESLTGSARLSADAIKGLDEYIASPAVHNILVGVGGGSNSISGMADVLLTNLADGQILQYQASSKKWVNATSSGGTWGSITGTFSDQTDLQTALDVASAQNNFSYYLTGLASDIGGNLQSTSAPYSGGFDFTASNSTGGGDFTMTPIVTNAGYPGLTFIPEGVFGINAYAIMTGAKTAQIYAVFNEVSATGTFIATIGTTSISTNLTASTVEYPLYFTLTSPYLGSGGNMGGGTSRIQCVIHVVFSAMPATLTTATVHSNSTQDSHISIPAQSPIGMTLPYLANNADTSTTFKLTVGNLVDTGLTASKVVFTDSGKQLTSTGIGTSGQFIKGDGSLDSNTYVSSSALSGYVPTSRTLTINGTTYDLTANRSWTVSGSGAAGSNTEIQINNSGVLGTVSGFSISSNTLYANNGAFNGALTVNNNPINSVDTGSGRTGVIQEDSSGILNFGTGDSGGSGYSWYGYSGIYNVQFMSLDSSGLNVGKINGATVDPKLVVYSPTTRDEVQTLETAVPDVKKGINQYFNSDTGKIEYWNSLTGDIMDMAGNVIDNMASLGTLQDGVSIDYKTSTFIDKTGQTVQTTQATKVTLQSSKPLTL